MEEKKIFILLENERLKYLEELIKDVFKDLNIPVKIVNSNEIQNEKLPKNFDFYFIHLTDLDNIKELKELKQTQPDSYFLEMGVRGGYFKGTERLWEESGGVEISYRTMEYILKKGLA